MANEPKSQEPNQLPPHMKWLVVMLCIVLGLSTIAIFNYALAVAYPIWKCGTPPHGGDVSFLAVVAATFGILITGVFVFMTFRIDHGARLEAHTTAKREVDRVLQRVEENARSTAEQAITRDKQEILNAAEVFAVNIANVLKDKTVRRLEQFQEDLNDAQTEIRDLTKQDGREPDRNG